MTLCLCRTDLRFRQHCFLDLFRRFNNKTAQYNTQKQFEKQNKTRKEQNKNGKQQRCIMTFSQRRQLFGSCIERNTFTALHSALPGCASAQLTLAFLTILFLVFLTHSLFWLFLPRQCERGRVCVLRRLYKRVAYVTITYNGKCKCRFVFYSIAIRPRSYTVCRLKQMFKCDFLCK